MLMAFIASTGRPQAIGPMQVSVAAIVQLAAIPLVGPVGASAVALVPVVTDRTSVIKRVFNTSQRLLIALAGSVGYYAVGGVTLAPGMASVDIVLLAYALAAASIAAAMMNAALLAGVLRLSAGGSYVLILRDLQARVLSSYAFSFVAAYLLVVLWSPSKLGWISALFFLPSIVVTQWALRQLAGEWAIRHEAVVPFVTALDVRHPGAGEASRLAANTANAVAAGLGLRPGRVDAVTIGARLSGVGRLALAGHDDHTPRPDDAAAARAVLEDVQFLARPLEFISCRRERMDGSGPQGLAGTDIPLGSRVVAVADTWTAAVMAGLAPEDAVRECESRVGTALDGDCVAALGRAYSRGQLPTPGSTT